MTIASEITRINTNIANAYTACNSKGATMPATQNSANLATCIDSISGGGSPFTGINREIVNGVYQAPVTSFTWSLPSNATDMETYALIYAFYNCTGLTSVDLSSLTTLSNGSAMLNAFYNCTSLTSADLSGLTTVSGSNAMDSAFYNCTALTNVDLSSLTTVSGNNGMVYIFSGCSSLQNISINSLTTVSGTNGMQYAFRNCTSLTSINFNNLTTIGKNSSSSNYGHFAYCFNGCTNLKTVSFPKLDAIYCTGGSSTGYGTFTNNNKVEKMYFPKLTAITYGSGASTSNQNACKNVFYNCASLTELHFGSANRSAIEASPGYSTAWGRGAGNVTIYFDL